MAHKSPFKRKALENQDLQGKRFKVGESVLSEDSDEDDDHQRRQQGQREDKRPRPGPGHPGFGASKAAPDIGRKLMSKMGYKEGKGLGKHEQGVVEAIATSTQKGRRGLGFSLSDVEVDPEFEWSQEKEKEWVSAIEQVNRLPECPLPPPVETDLKEWVLEGPKKLEIADEVMFCEPLVVKGVIECKNVFDRLSGHELRRARSMSNPFETVEKGIFQNRAAMKMANIDANFDFMFTEPRDEGGKSTLNPEDLLYFADICAGPGGFSEYILWRKGWEAKGFGFTLKGPNDFKLEEFFAGSAETFEPHYGENARDGDGDIYKPSNLISFRDFVIKNSDGKGVHFVMADGGFSVEGQENIQEILSKRLYLCQFLCALGILRIGGHFVCKLFDLFTPFSVGLIYLMYRSFQQVTIYKPNTSRPANSERYLVCKGKRNGTTDIENCLFRLNCQLDYASSQGLEEDIVQVVPLQVLRDDAQFFSYIRESNSSLGRRQILFLSKVKAFAEEPTLIEPRQNELKREMLAYWKVPNKGRMAPSRPDPKEKYKELIGKDKEYVGANGFGYQPTFLSHANVNSLEYPCSFKCMVLGGDPESGSSGCRGFFLGLGKCNVFYWDGVSTTSGWRKSELRVLLPPDTLFYGEQVTELSGEGKGQRRRLALHVIDALVLGGKDVRRKPFEERILMANRLVKAVKKPTQADLLTLRVKKVYELISLESVFQDMDMKECKGRNNNVRLCHELDPQMFAIPAGLLVLNTIKLPWISKVSHSQGKRYFFNLKIKGGISNFDCPPDAVADFLTTFTRRLFWKWNSEANLTNEQPEGRKNGKIEKEDGIDRNSLTKFIESALKK